ncbi:hypothetical protein V8C86DRAFT_882797 [Haematococcus lacustris]
MAYSLDSFFSSNALWRAAGLRGHVKLNIDRVIFEEPSLAQPRRTGGAAVPAWSAELVPPLPRQHQAPPLVASRLSSQGDGLARRSDQGQAVGGTKRRCPSTQQPAEPVKLGLQQQGQVDTAFLTCVPRRRRTHARRRARAPAVLRAHWASLSGGCSMPMVLPPELQLMFPPGAVNSVTGWQWPAGTGSSQLLDVCQPQLLCLPSAQSQAQCGGSMPAPLPLFSQQQQELLNLLGASAQGQGQQSLTAQAEPGIQLQLPQGIQPANPITNTLQLSSPLNNLLPAHTSLTSTTQSPFVLLQPLPPHSSDAQAALCSAAPLRPWHYSDVKLEVGEAQAPGSEQGSGCAQPAAAALPGSIVSEGHVLQLSPALLTQLNGGSSQEHLLLAPSQLSDKGPAPPPAPSKGSIPSASKAKAASAAVPSSSTATMLATAVEAGQVSWASPGSCQEGLGLRKVQDFAWANSNTSSADTFPASLVTLHHVSQDAQSMGSLAGVTTAKAPNPAGLHRR